MDTFGERLKYARNARRLTQKQVAAGIGIERVNVSKWEKDEYMPGARRLPALAAVLGVTEDWLLSGRGEPPKPVTPDPARLEEMITLLQRLPEEEFLRELAYLRQKLRSSTSR